MAGLAPEGSQFDTRQFDAKMTELLGTEQQEFFFSHHMMRFMKVSMPWVCKKTFLGASMLMVLRSRLLFSKGVLFRFARVLM
ncbi:hypothetical protein P3L10_022678 [Capsicum annuum]